MKIRYLISRILILLLSIFSIFFFFSIFYDSKVAKSDIEAVSGNTYVLTASIGNTNEHYFKDKGNNSTLINAKVSEEGGDYYSLIPNSGLLLGKLSSGYAIVRATNDINALIQKNVVYAQATFSFKSNKNNAQSNIQVTISQGDNKETVTTSYNGGNKLNYSTQMIKLDSSSTEIKFEWTTCAKTETGKYSDFVLSEPTIKLYTQIDNVYFENEDQNVSSGDIIKLNSYNDVLSVNNVKGNFLNYSKVNHAISYNVLQGGQYVEIIGDTLYISDDATNSTIIKIQAKAKANSYSNDYIYSQNILTLTVNETSVQVKVQTDFKNSPQIIGEGLYTPGRRIFLHYKPQTDFIFEGWYVNGELQSTEDEFLYTVKANDVIYAKFIKQVSILSIGVNNKIYDGTTNIDQDDIIFKFDGVEENHEVFLSGTNFSFATPTAGENKEIIVEDYSKIVLSGSDAQFYQLKSQYVPKSYATILKRDLIITPIAAEKQYRDADPTLRYETQGLLESDTLEGSLSREQGEDVGEYSIYLGTLSNINYNLNMASGEFNFVITQRKLTLEKFYPEDKVYDGTTSVPITVALGNIYNNEDVSLIVEANYSDSNAGNGKIIRIDKFELNGNNKGNYCIDQPTTSLVGNILKKEVTVKAVATEMVYGDPLNLSYEVTLIEGDSLSGSLAIEDTNVGTHEIQIGTLSNPNYTLSFESAYCVILQKELKVSADSLSKEYGDGDPILTYSVEGLIIGDALSGNLTREPGEVLGTYAIMQGSLYNRNYNISFSEGSFEIIQRTVSVEISFEDKQYDGLNTVNYSANFKNILAGQVIEVEIDARLLSVDVGNAEVEILSKSINGEALENFKFEFNITNSIIQIKAREVVVEVSLFSKIYGEQDPEISFSLNNVVYGDEIVGSVKRNIGEDVGEYTYYLEGFNGPNNPNYSFTLYQKECFKILPRDLNLQINQLSKFYGDNDPEFNFYNIDDSQLQFDDKLENLFTGRLTRETGENVGIYQILTNELIFSKNYNLIFEDLNFIINKRPITIVANDATKVYGEEDPEFTYSATNLVEGQPVYVTIKRVYGENVGEYEMILSSSNDSRYLITFVPGVLNITQSKITLRAESKIKFYGDEDPQFDAVIIDGLLKNNDVLENIIQGEMEREPGENVGEYKIYQGTFNLGENYKVDFEPNMLEIIKQNIEVTANLTTKQYGDSDPIIGYSITNGQLKFSDDFEGVLSREPGETLGIYEINQGTLLLNENYDLTFVSNYFTIEKRYIKIVPSNTSKIYGENEPNMDYIIVGSLVNDDVLEGYLYRDKPTTDKDPYLYENVGSYKIYSTLQHENYEIEFDNYYFKVLPRVIEIKALDNSKTYGENDPQLQYQIISGEILEGDAIEGDVFRVAGEDAGTYDIRSNLNLGRNYTILFTKGVFVIKPIEILIKSDNYEKTYGQMDPVFTYIIVDGELINGDVLYGGLTREQGEDVGIYKILSNLSNVNYNIVIEESYLTIEKKDVYMLASVYDKIYDGNNNAVMKSPVVSGLVDKDVSLYYDKNNCAKFSSVEVGDNIPITFYGITLVGASANNYNLIYPTNVTASITYNKLTADEDTVSVEAIDNACLYEGTSLNFINFDITREEMGLNKYQVVSAFDIWLESDEQAVNINSTIQLSIKLDSDFADRNNIYVYHKNSNGEYVLVNSVNENGEIIIKIDELGEFVIMTDNDAWIDIVSYVCIAVLGLFAICYIVYLIKNRKKIKKFEE